MTQLMLPIWAAHDRKRFEVMAVSIGPEDEVTAKKVRPAFEHMVSARGMDDRELAEALNKNEIDILVDLMGWTPLKRPRVLAQRPAPIQVAYLGFAGTTGLEFIDYVIADQMVVPKEHEAFFSERIVRLPDSYIGTAYDAFNASETRADHGLPERAFVFCVFNRQTKITREFFGAWMRLLRATEGSVLWLLRPDSHDAKTNLRRHAESQGVGASRLIFAERMPLDRHLARHGLADLFLDTLPYNAHTTAVDALWAGLPVVTCLGGTFAGRVGASFLAAVGMPELITNSLDEYELTALRLATHPEELSTIRTKLVSNRAGSPLFDAQRFARNLETAFIEMVARHQRGEPPSSFSVE
jgi:predicted O-linked N-acetylglucosamine transferase (SPINDLY family)